MNAKTELDPAAASLLAAILAQIGGGTFEPGRVS